MATVNDFVKATGRVSIVITGPDGKVKETVEIDNLVVTVGKNFITSRMAGATKNPMSHMAIGSGSTAPAAGNTTLGTELARVALNVSGGTATANSIEYVGTFAPGVGTGTVYEAGLFNAGAAGDMLARVTFPIVTKGATDQMAITWTVTIN